MAARVVLQMDVHCSRCAKKIRNCVRNMLGVDRVWASPSTGTVVVTGTADASMLRWRIEHTIRRPVTILSDGRASWERPHFEGIRHLAPPSPPPPTYGWGMVPPPHPYAGYPYAGNQHWTTPPAYQQYGTPSIFDDTIPGNYCSIL